MTVELGLMSLGDLLPDPTTGIAVSEAERHRSLVDQAVLAEQLGFASMHLGEHHFCDYMLSAPPVVLAAIGERTTSLKLSTAVTLAGNLDPVRIAEDYATVDVLNDGRVELVLGRGSIFVKTYEGFGHDVDTARERYDENVRLLTRLLREEDVTWSGAFRAPLNGHTTRPRPQGEMSTWIGAASKGSADLAADLDCHLMLPSVFGKPEMFVPIVDLFRARCDEIGRDFSAAKIGACSHIHVGRTSQQARRDWEPYYRNYWQFVGGLIGENGMWPEFNLDELLAGPGICGSPAEVIDKLGIWAETFGLDRHLLMFDLGGMSHQLVVETLELFGSEVAAVLT